MAGFLPPGVFFRDDAYFYEGQIGGGRNTRIGGNVVAGVKQRTFINFATPIWVTPVEVLGGNLAFSLTVPLGEPAVRANAVLTGPVRANPRVRTATPEAHVAPSTTLYREAFSKLETRDSGATAAFASLVGNRPDDRLASFHLRRLLNGETGTVITLG